MSIFLPTQALSIPHARRIDRLVCAMHADRNKQLAMNAELGVVVTVEPVRVVIRRQQKALWARILESVGFIPRLW